MEIFGPFLLRKCQLTGKIGKTLPVITSHFVPLLPSYRLPYQFLLAQGGPLAPLEVFSSFSIARPDLTHKREGSTTALPFY
jgi:hypothetical protein